MYKPYVLVSPPFDPTSGGIRVMWGLYGWLLAKGQIAYMNQVPQGDIVAIYPEIQHGNPANARTVVRYILNTPGVMGSFVSGRFTPGPTSFPPGDKLYYFSRIFGGSDHDRYLFLPILNLHLFKDQKKKRTKTCYLVGKGVDQKKHPEGSIELTRQFATDQQALADLLNECSVFYCYDTMTAMMEVARLCGCRVQYYGEYPKEKLSLYEPGMNGIGMGDEDIPLRVDDFRELYIRLGREFNRKLDQFIGDTQ